MTKPFLALFRAGPGSLHTHAVERLAAQNFDYALSWFGDSPPTQSDDAVFVHLQKGPKWLGLEQTLGVRWDVIERYDFVWLPDDDLLCVPEDVSRMFTICEELGLDLAQPALTRDSYFTHAITLQHTAFQLRFTNFVEIMAPILSATMLKRIAHTLDGKISGFGLDTLWPRLSEVGRIAIIDDTPVKHTRPVGGPNYAMNLKAGIAPAHEALYCSAAHLNDTPADFQINLGGLLQSGDPLCIGNEPKEIDAMLEAVSSSCDELRLTALRRTHYLGNHLNYWFDGRNGRGGYPRGLLRVALNQALKHTGIRFPAPDEAARAAVAQQAAAAELASDVPAATAPAESATA